MRSKFQQSYQYFLSTAANEGFAIFKIESVENTKSAASFHLTPEHLYVSSSFGALRIQIRRFAQTMGFTSIARTTVPAGEKLDINGFIIIPLGTNNPSGGSRKPISIVSTLRMILEVPTVATNKTYLTVSSSPKQTHPTRSGRWSKIAKNCRLRSGCHKARKFQRPDQAGTAPHRDRRVGISAPNSLLRGSISLLGIKLGSKIPCKIA